MTTKDRAHFAYIQNFSVFPVVFIFHYIPVTLIGIINDYLIVYNSAGFFCFFFRKQEPGPTEQFV
jgi:hypothetical protein